MDHGEGYMRKEVQGKQYRSWLGIEVKGEFFVETEEENKVPRNLEQVWEAVADGER